jgi:hypothetical protein
MLELEADLMRAAMEIDQDTFVEWYDSPAVPAYGKASDRCRLIEQWMADEFTKRNAHNAANAVGKE